MMSPGSSSCLITGLLPGVGYQVCVLAIYYDGTIVPSVAATRLLGCVDFVTEETGDGDSSLCSSSSSISSSMANDGAVMPGQLLGGTMVIIIGGIIVACLLVFTVILVIGYKACAANDGTTKTSSRANGAGGTAAGGTSGAAGPADGYSAATAVAASHPNSNSSNSNGNNGGAAAPAGLPVQASYGDVVRELNQLKLAKAPDPASDVKPATLPRAPRTARLGADLGAESPPPPAAAAATERATLPRRLTAHRRSVASMPQRSGDVSPPADSSTPAVWPRGVGRRATRSLSFDGGSFPHGVPSLGLSGAGQPRRAGGMWTKRSMSVNGMVPSVEDGKLSGRKAIFSSSDWILESTV